MPSIFYMCTKDTPASGASLRFDRTEVHHFDNPSPGAARQLPDPCCLKRRLYPGQYLAGMQ